MGAPHTLRQGTEADASALLEFFQHVVPNGWQILNACPPYSLPPIGHSWPSLWVVEADAEIVGAGWCSLQDYVPSMSVVLTDPEWDHLNVLLIARVEADLGLVFAQPNNQVRQVSAWLPPVPHHTRLQEAYVRRGWQISVLHWIAPEPTGGRSKNVRTWRPEGHM
ncbi:hypothetical protein [Deinococcus sp. QL22]|uniref:hypothetical protein n=1 Tax=Deinococcus sp. QL22 TaxID=2939437 RepID=UPI0020181897|nr:hypothetical protein [Deinococcus sp. QL22]UQN09451.1 hypothetical protein M1R55_23130 [Deinococcus sp. QL22]